MQRLNYYRVLQLIVHIRCFIGFCHTCFLYVIFSCANRPGLAG